MKFNILTIFPNIFTSYFSESIIKRAQEQKKIKINIIDIRQFTDKKHLKIDDTLYGGGPGMLMRIEPIVNALRSVINPGKIILLTPSGKKINQQEVFNLVQEKNLTFICGHYEGIDSRISHYINAEYSIGDFVVTGGELPAMLMVDIITRLVTNVIKQESFEDDSFANGLLEYPQYTKPALFATFKVPDVLLSGHHQKIQQWRLKESLRNTWKKRPDLLTTKQFSINEKKILKEIIEEENDL